MPWDPAQYERFKAERSEPFEDLVGLVRARPGMRVVDLGCGTGELTRRLADLLPDSEVVGIDSSEEMLARSGAFGRPGVRFEFGDLRELSGTFDLVFSNAALQWVEDHERLIPALWEHLEPGGRLAVQVPANFDHVSHRLAADLAAGQFASSFPEPPRRPSVLAVEEYAEILFELGGSDIVAMMKVYPHVLPSADAVVEWVRGTLLTAYLDPLPGEPARAAFLGRYREALRAHLPQQPVFYGFKRILFAATRPGW